MSEFWFRPIRLQNAMGMQLECIPFGATLTRLQVPDKRDNLVDVVVGLTEPIEYGSEANRKHNWCLGATIGPFAGRIGSGGFSMDDGFIPLPGTNGVHLHGHDSGWQYKIWDLIDQDSSTNSVSFGLNVPAGTGGYPGNVSAKVKYTLGPDHLEISYWAISDAPTVINPTNHAYFNPSGNESLDAVILKINSDRVLVTDQDLVPTGELKRLEGSGIDYRQERYFDPRFPMDHCFVLKGKGSKAMSYSPTTGITMEVRTDQPGMVVFTPERLLGVRLYNGMENMRFPAVCFECQAYPDAPNHPDFPSTRLNPGQSYSQTTRYSFRLD